jgi:hypothetical protein
MDEDPGFLAKHFVSGILGKKLSVACTTGRVFPNIHGAKGADKNQDLHPFRV